MNKNYIRLLTCNNLYIFHNLLSFITHLKHGAKRNCKCWTALKTCKHRFTWQIHFLLGNNRVYRGCHLNKAKTSLPFFPFLWKLLRVVVIGQDIYYKLNQSEAGQNHAWLICNIPRRTQRSRKDKPKISINVSNSVQQKMPSGLWTGRPYVISLQLRVAYATHQKTVCVQNCTYADTAKSGCQTRKQPQSAICLTRTTLKLLYIFQEKKGSQTCRRSAFLRDKEPFGKMFGFFAPNSYPSTSLSSNKILSESMTTLGWLSRHGQS